MKAFPTTWFGGEVEKPIQYVQEGMDLRDYFAAKALQVFLSQLTEEYVISDACIDAYYVADAMMEAGK